MKNKVKYRSMVKCNIQYHLLYRFNYLVKIVDY
jgi:hypothetical protein